MSEETITGGRELDVFLQTLPVKVERNILRAALRAGANEFKAEAKSRIPVAHGDLLRSARVTTGSKAGVVYARLKVGGKNAPHWHWVEFGTAAHKIMPKGAGALHFGATTVDAVHHPGAKPHPFMRPAFDAKSTAAIAAVAAKIRERLTAEGINSPAPETI